MEDGEVEEEQQEQEEEEQPQEDEPEPPTGAADNAGSTTQCVSCCSA
jgi:hypothetical protein